MELVRHELEPCGRADDTDALTDSLRKVRGEVECPASSQ